LAYENALAICLRLSEAGHTAYLAGGCVRDALLGREPKDFDVATDATPDRVREVFGRRRTLAFGASFGVIGVLPERPRSSRRSEHASPQSDSPNPAAQLTEVATFRSDGEYSDGRRPDRVHFGDARHDALRRDFTINGLFYDPLEQRVIDYVEGQTDLARQILRTIGAAKERFEEDKLRMLRAARFATTLDFRLDPETKSEIITRADEIGVVSSERVGAEMRRLVTSPNAPTGLRLILECGLQRQVFPDLAACDFADVERLLQARAAFDFESSVALLLIAVEQSHPHASTAALTHELSTRWRLSNEENRRIRAAIEHWHVVADADQLKWSVVQPVLVHRDIDCILSVAQAMVTAEDRSTAGIDQATEALAWSPEQLDPSPLITGQTLQQAGYRPGPNFRQWLQTIRAAQLDGKLNSPVDAMEQIRRLAESSTD
jgi:tRNA nucleotidyltransferase (CCA-adding enzyme)